MALTYVSQVGADEGIMQAAPNTRINESNLFWAQDILFDRPGYLRRRGPFNSKDADALASGEMIAGVSHTNDPSGAWKLCALASDADSSRMVFFDTDGNISGWSWLPFKHPNGSYLFTNTDEQNETIRTTNPMTMMLGRPALNSGSWLSVFTRYGVPTFSSGGYPSFQSLYYWRGGTGIDCYTPSATIGVNTNVEGTGAQYSQHSPIITINTAIDSVISGESPKVTPGMFVFDATPGASGRPYQCIGVVKSVNLSGGTGSITLEHRPMIAHYREANGGTKGFNSADNGVAQIDGVVLHFRNIRGFQHMHGRGLITLASGNVVTSGIEGTDGEGHFAAAKMNQGSWYVYRNSDRAIIGKVDATATISNTQFQLTSGNTKVKLTSDEYVAVPVETTLSSDNVSGVKMLEPSPYYQPRISGKVDDKAAGTSYDESVRTYKDVPGYLTATYAGYQWFGSLGQLGYENQIVFSGYHDPEAVDLSPDAADSIVIPGTNIMRGLATSAAGLVVFMSDNTYIVRGNTRENFSLEVLYPEGCLSATSIVEIGGGVMWAATSGILYFDGASVRNLTKDYLGTYYYDGVRHFDAEADRIYAFVYKNYLFVSFSKWVSSYQSSRFEPVYVNTDAGDAEGQSIEYGGTIYPPETYTDYGYTWDDMLNRRAALTYDQVVNDYPFVSFAVYLPAGSITTMANFSFTGAGFVDAVSADNTNQLNYDKSWVAVNARKIVNSEFIPGKPVNKVTNAQYALVSGTPYVAVTYTPATGDIYADSKLVDLVDRNDEAVLSSKTISNYSSGSFRVALGYTPAFPASPTNGQVFTDSAGLVWIYSSSVWKVRDVVGLIIPEYKISNFGLFVGLDNMLDIKTNDYDDYISLSDRWPGPDMYFQTKVYTVGDPVLKKWFQRLFVSMLIKGGAVRIDMLDYENNDFITTQAKQRNWVLLPEVLYSWNSVEQTQLSNIINIGNTTNPDGFTGVLWDAVEDYAVNNSYLTWDELLFPAFERRMKKFSLRTNALGYQFYQLNRWKPTDSSRAAIIKPKRVETDAWSIGFKPLRTGRQ